MTRAEYLEFFKDFCDQMLETTRKKNNDYAGAADDDPFFNFTRGEAMKFGTTEQGFMFRMSDKFSRLATAVARGEHSMRVSDESVDDTLMDLAVYSVIFAAYRRSKREE